MDDETLRVLLVEDSVVEAHRIRVAFRQDAPPAHVTHAARLDAALRALESAEGFDAVLLDLALPDGRGLEALSRLRVHAPESAVVVLAGAEHGPLAVEALQEGAQDFLVRGQVPPDRLPRFVRNAVERHRVLLQDRATSLLDELTHVSNRRGFCALAAQQMKASALTGRRMFLLRVDLDGMSEINDSLGHAAGERALIDTAELLRRTFPDPDLVGRLGSDEFAVLAVESSDRADTTVLARLQENLASHNLTWRRLYQLSVSVGMISADPAGPATLEQLLAGAAAPMHRRPLRRSARRPVAALAV